MSLLQSCHPLLDDIHRSDSAKITKPPDLRHISTHEGTSAPHSALSNSTHLSGMRVGQVTQELELRTVQLPCDLQHERLDQVGFTVGIVREFTVG